ncbi:Zinc finger 511, partial [Paramuricea clavata]
EKIVCDLFGCQKIFTSVASYEAHYGSFHRNICLECHRSFPSNFLLDLHILENHDVLFKLMSNAKYTHRCLVESCPDKFSNDDERKEHLVTVHKYPANFRFNRPTRKQRKLTDASEDMEITSNMNIQANVTTTRTESSTDSMEVADEHVLEKRRVPKGICFGRGSMMAFQRKGQSRRGRK